MIDSSLEATDKPFYEISKTSHLPQLRDRTQLPVSAPFDYEIRDPTLAMELGDENMLEDAPACENTLNGMPDLPNQDLKPLDLSGSEQEPDTVRDSASEEWSEVPSSIVIHKPYGLARLPRHVEIRSLDAPYPLIVLRDVHLLQQSNNCVIAAVGSSIYGLLPVPAGALIVQLTASSNFVGALALCKLLPPEDSSLRAAKEASIHIRYGHYLFDNGSYEESMEQFLASQVDITYVLSLYPSITLPKDLTIVEPEKFQELTDAFYVSRVSSDVSDDMESSMPSQFYESDDKSTVEDKKKSYNAIMALAKNLQRKIYSVIERATAEVTEEVVSDAVQGSITTSEPYGSKSSSKKRGHPHISSVGRELATILDTALIQALLLTGQFLVSENVTAVCDVNAGMDVVLGMDIHGTHDPNYRCVNSPLATSLQPNATVSCTQDICGNASTRTTTTSYVVFAYVGTRPLDQRCLVVFENDLYRILLAPALKWVAFIDFCLASRDTYAVASTLGGMQNSGRPKQLIPLMNKIEDIHRRCKFFDPG